jgi:uncharacterized membrane protein
VAGVYVVVQWTKHPITGPQAIGPIVLIATGIFTCGLLEGVTALSRIELEGERKRDLEPEAAQEIAQVTHEIVRLIELALAVAFSLGTVLGLGSKSGVHWSFPWLTVLCVALAIAVGSSRLVECARGLKARGLGKGLEGWNGIVYRNTADPRLWVPKLGGIGYTLNFAHRWAWPMLALLLFPAAVLLLLGLHLRP